MSAREAWSVKGIIMSRNIARGMSRAVDMLARPFETGVTTRHGAANYVRHPAMYDGH